MFQQFIFPAISFAMSATFIPGPLIAYLVNTTLTAGWRKALLVVMAPIITDAPIIIVMTFLLGQLPDTVLNFIRLAGGLLLLTIAYGSWKQYTSGNLMKQLEGYDGIVPTQSARRILVTGLMMNLLSPGPYLFAATINGPLLLKALEISPLHAVVFLMTFYGTFMLGLSGWVLIFHKVRQVDIRYLRIIILLTIGLLLWFGISLIVTALGLNIV